MVSIYAMQKYLSVFELVEAWSGFIVAAFHWVLALLAVANAVFSVAIWVWYAKATSEALKIEEILDQMPLLDEYSSSSMAEVDVEKCVCAAIAPNN
ncbi:hypothetical protein BC830DRAFT_1138266 [Chytriomyces sp. MP71]|nr:hypothetical protein BC830DRAFT_1138266 [Chytriomyces sp. MP71]